jgi:hypothetical protein
MGAAQGTHFVDITSLDLANLGNGHPPLRERIARANLATTERIGVGAVEARLDAIRRDRDETYGALAARA